MAIKRTRYHQLPTFRAGEDMGAGQQPQRPNFENVLDGTGINNLIQKQDEALQFFRALDDGVTASQFGQILKGGLVNITLPNIADDETIYTTRGGRYSIKNVPNIKFADNTITDKKITEDSSTRYYTLIFCDELITYAMEQDILHPMFKRYPSRVKFENVDCFGVPIIGNCQPIQLVVLMETRIETVSLKTSIEKINLNTDYVIHDGDTINVLTGERRPGMRFSPLIRTGDYMVSVTNNDESMLRHNAKVHTFRNILHIPHDIGNDELTHQVMLKLTLRRI